MSTELTKIRQFLWRDVVLNPAMVVVIIGVLILLVYYRAVSSPSFLQFPD